MGNVVMQKQVLAVSALLALLSGCGSREGEITAPGIVPAAAELPKEISAGEKVYRNTCSICHRLGLKGAPRLGDREDWALRLAQGNEILYVHAVKGYRGSKGSMPSRGSNAKLSGDEVKAAVDYMVWYSMPKPHGPFGSQVFSAATKQFTIRQLKD